MKKLLLSACVAAACWVSDVGAMKYQLTEAEYKMEIEGPRKVCEARKLGTSEEDVALLKDCAEFPCLEQIEIEEENAWIFRRPNIEDPDFFLIGAGLILTNDDDPKIKDVIAYSERGAQILKKRIKSFPKLKRITGRATLERITGEDDPYIDNPLDLYRSFYDEYDPDYDYDCSMKRILQDITRLQTLEEIDLNGWSLFTDLPQEIGNLRNLRVLSIAESYLSKLPESIGNLKNLQHLELRNLRQLRSLPESIGNLKNLQSLSLRETYIESLPECIKGLSKLKRLDLRNNPRLNHLPDFIWEMPSLEEVMVDEKLLDQKFQESIQESTLALLFARARNLEWSDEQLSKVVKLRINGVPFPSKN